MRDAPEMAWEMEAMNRMAGIFRSGGLGLVAAIAMLGGAMSTGNAQAPDKTASIHGHVNNAAGLMVPDATVRLTTDHTTDPKTVKWKYTFPVDEKGDYKGSGILNDTYIVVVVSKGVTIDYFADKTFKAGEDKLLDFDMQRKDFIDKMTPEQRTALEEFKKTMAATLAANKTVGNLNLLLKQARDANAAGKYEDGVTAMTTATQQAPDQAVLWLTLGDSQLGLADQAAKAAKGTPTDPSIAQKYTDAAGNFKKAIDLNAASKKPNPETAANASDRMGVALSKSGDLKGAADAFDNAAKADPPNGGRYLLNEAVTFYNAGKYDEAAVASDKAIAADPKKVDAYFIKGQSLIQHVSVDSKTNKVTAPPGCEDAYQKYLELAPEGQHAAEVREILTGIGATVKSSYKADKKKG